MKYIVDIDSLLDCLDFTAFANVNGKPSAHISDVKELIRRFPKYQIEEDICIKIENNVKANQ